FRAVTTQDGSYYWTAGGTQGCFGVEHGASEATLVSSTVTNLRTVTIFNEQVYITHASGTTNGRVMAVGTGLPKTAGNSMVALPGLPASGSACSPLLLDLNPSVAGPDVLYVADDGQGILKYSLVGSSWTLNGVYGTNEDDYRGLTGKAESNGTVTLFATRKGATASGAGGGELVKIEDASGYNASITSATLTLLATAATNTTFRGVAFAPVEQALNLSLLAFSASTTSRGQVLNWTSSNELTAHSYEVERSDDGAQFRRIMTVPAKGSAGLNSYEQEDLAKAVGKVYYRIRMIDKEGKSKYSRTLALAPARSGRFRLYPNPLADSHTLTITHGETRGAGNITIFTNDGRQVTSIPVPVRATQTSLNLQHLPAGTYRVVMDADGQRQSAQLLKQ
ncbi:MAG: T9SS type A sorting domain-containing protein, partial [Chitinophagaceae bacterium]|nr:T9SS type A sorting domain-containing protein [Chitinophagaceae bacterium]